MPTLVALLAAFLLATSAAGQEVQGGARAAALGASTALGGDVWGTANPATWGPLVAPVVAFSGGEMFGLAALRHGAMAAAFPFRPATFAVAAHTFGFAAFRETRVRLGAAPGLHLGTTRRLYVGAAVTYVHTTIPDYGAAGAVGLSVGSLVTILPGLHVGVHARNVNGPALGGREALPQALALGVLLQRGDLLLAVDVYDDVRFPLAARAGIEASPVSALALRASVASAPARIALGAGVRAGPITVDAAAARHAVLGWSPTLTVALTW